MSELLSLLANGYVIVYVLLVVLIQWIYVCVQRDKKKQIADNRQDQGLPLDILVNQSKKLEDLKAEAKSQAKVLILPILFLPFILSLVEYKVNCHVNKQISCSVQTWVTDSFVTKTEVIRPSIGAIKSSVDAVKPPEEAKAKYGLLFTFLIFLLWLLTAATDLAKATIGGIAFRTVTAFANTFQVGDRVTVKGLSGKLTDIGVFYLTLVTLDDDKICLPTNSLWGAELTTANDGERSSLVVISFYLSPTVTYKQLGDTEDAIWEAIQASNYFEPSKPKQIYYQQQPHYIELIAKAYVASTYNEPLFRSDIYRRFFEFVKKEDILLAHQSHDINIHNTERS